MPLVKEKEKQKVLNLRRRMNKEWGTSDIKKLHYYKSLAWMDPDNIEYFQKYTAMLLRLGESEKAEVLLLKHISYPKLEKK